MVLGRRENFHDIQETTYSTQREVFASKENFIRHNYLLT